jgi:hypothetical protein
MKPAEYVAAQYPSRPNLALATWKAWERGLPPGGRHPLPGFIRMLNLADNARVDWAGCRSMRELCDRLEDAGALHNADAMIARSLLRRPDLTTEEVARQMAALPNLRIPATDRESLG